jgi:hypothetical protein
VRDAVFDGEEDPVIRRHGILYSHTPRIHANRSRRSTRQSQRGYTQRHPLCPAAQAAPARVHGTPLQQSEAVAQSWPY